MATARRRAWGAGTAHLHREVQATRACMLLLAPIEDQQLAIPAIPDGIFAAVLDDGGRSLLPVQEHCAIHVILAKVIHAPERPGTVDCYSYVAPRFPLFSNVLVRQLHLPCDSQRPDRAVRRLTATDNPVSVEINPSQ